MRSNLFFTLLVVSLMLGCSEDNTLKVLNVKTESHIDIPHSQYSIVPPEGFEIDPYKIGVADYSRGYAITIFEIPVPYQECSPSFSEEKLPHRLLEREVVQMEGYEAQFVMADDFGMVMKLFHLFLVFGTEEKTTVVKGISPMGADSKVEEIKESILSICYDPDQKYQPGENPYYKIDVSRTGLKFDGVMTWGGVWYKLEDEDLSPGGGSTGVVVHSERGSFKEEDKRGFAVSHFSSTTRETIIESIEEVTIDGLKGYEIYGYKQYQEDDFETLKYKTILFSKSRYYICEGTATRDYAKNLEMFMQVSRTFERDK